MVVPEPDQVMFVGSWYRPNGMQDTYYIKTSYWSRLINASCTKSGIDRLSIPVYNFSRSIND
uniref:Uncharacterized protein n=1 Tax=Arundo donax TaxID=35708 RepID=A0A0A9AI67_ARUDO